jgi:hypothetical protein
MNMDSPNNISANAADNMAGRWRQVKVTQHSQANRGDATLRAEYEQVIRRALEAEPDDTKAVEVERAKIELRTGQLESPEAIEAAARNIMLFGI